MNEEDVNAPQTPPSEKEVPEIEIGSEQKQVEDTTNSNTTSATNAENQQSSETSHISTNIEPNPYRDRTSEMTMNAIPEEVKGWNWGAFAFNIFWGIGNKSYLPLLCLIPFFNLVWIFVCGAKGNEWAWQNGEYTSIEEFKAVQATWKRAGLVQAILMIVGFVFSIIAFVLLLIFGVTAGSIIEDNYNNLYDDNNYYDYNYDYEETVPSASITDIDGWTQKIYDDITLATETIDPETSVATYQDGTSFEELVAIVGQPEDTIRDGNMIEATWWSDSYDYIEVYYDVASGLITDKYNSL